MQHGCAPQWVPQSVQPDGWIFRGRDSEANETTGLDPLGKQRGTHVGGVLLVLLDATSKICLELRNDVEVTGLPHKRLCQVELLGLGVLHLMK